MIPRKVNEFCTEIAEELQLSPDAVTDAVDFYWKRIKKEMTEPTAVNIVVKHFGIFEARKKQTIYLIEKYKGLAKYIKPVTYAKHVLLDLAVKKLHNLENLLKLIEEQEQKKKQVRENQKNGKIV